MEKMPLLGMLRAPFTLGSITDRPASVMSTMSWWVLCTVRAESTQVQEWTRRLRSTAYLEHDIERTIIIDFDLHHGRSPSS